MSLRDKITWALFGVGVSTMVLQKLLDLTPHPKWVGFFAGMVIMLGCSALAHRLTDSR